MLDASAAVVALLRWRSAGPVRTRIGDAKGRLHVPDFFDLEVVSAIRGQERGRHLSGSEAGAAIASLGRLPVRRWSHELLRARIWALRHGLTPYDAAYVALAEALEVPLVTTDARLARAAAGSQAKIELL